MSAHPTRGPSPADVARLPPRSAAAAQPRGRRTVELEQDRARREVRAAIADPATDFAGMDADRFSAMLRQACIDGIRSVALVAETGRRIAAGSVAARDLHQVLLVAGPEVGWQQVRAAATVAAARRPHVAVEVLNLEVQRLGCPPLQIRISADAHGYTAQATLDLPDGSVQGSPRSDTAKKRAGQQAALSLLARLVGVDDPPTTTGPTQTTGTTGPPAAPIPVASVPDPADLEAWLDHEVSRPHPDPDLAEHLTTGRLTTRALHLLLFEAAPDGWRRLRSRAWQVLVDAPTQAPGVLSVHTQSRSWAPAAYLEPREGTAIGFVVTPDGPVVGEPAVAAAARSARAAAALSLVGTLARPRTADALPDDERAGGPGPAPDPAGAVSRLNERAQVGAVTELTYTTEVSGPPHQPVYSCTARCVHARSDCASQAEAATKAAAKAAAATGLLEQVVAAERLQVARLAQTRHDAARTPAGMVSRLLRAGYPVEVDGGGLQVTGPLPAALAGLRLPLSAALPALATLDGPVHPTTQVWVTTTRAALEAVAARRVHPALDADGRDCWRLTPPVPQVRPGPPDAALAGFHDAVADLLLRPPGAALVVGDLPFAGRSRALDPDTADWVDQVCDVAEGDAAAPLVIRLAAPDADGRPVQARLLSDAGPTVPDADLLSLAQQRLLRRAARSWPPLERVRRQGTLHGSDAADLLGPTGDRLAELGISVQWPAELVAGSGLQTRAVVAVRDTGGSDRFALDGVADLCWQFCLDGEPLTAEETRAAAEAVCGVLRVRGRWVVLDAEARRRARDQDAGRLTGAQALVAALTGRVDVEGRSVECSAGGRLADLLAGLRVGARVDGSPPGVPRPTPDGLAGRLRDYQSEGVEWLVRTTSAGFGALLADDMGLGKTLTVIAFRLARRPAGPTLVVCPASLLVNWERELARFAPGLATRRHHATERSLGDLASDEVVVTTYGTLLRDVDTLAAVRWDLVVADEAQHVKNHRSQAAQALRRLRPQVRVAVTGTPIENSLSDLWSLLDWTNPGLFGSRTGFRDRFGRAAEQAVVDADTDREAAHRLGRLVAPFVLRRRKSDPDVAADLPDKLITPRYVELSREQAALYQAATDEALEQITSGDGQSRRGQVLRLLQALRQICNSPAHYLREPVDGWDATRQAARAGKLQALEDILETVVVGQDAALVFTGYVTMGHLVRAHLVARGFEVEFVHGGMSLPQRQDVVDRFQAGAGDALVLSVRAAGTGLNLTRAGHVVHVDRPWNPAVEDQATDRAHRIGRQQLVEVHHLITAGTVEDRIAHLLARKRDLTETVLGAGSPALTELSDRDLAALVRLADGPATGGRA